MRSPVLGQPEEEMGLDLLGTEHRLGFDVGAGAYLHLDFTQLHALTGAGVFVETSLIDHAPDIGRG
jgi:hypothetical protein